MRKLARRQLTYERPGLRQRITRFVRALFSSGPDEPWLEPPAGGLGVREPRRPLHPTLSGTAVLGSPPEEKRDVWAVGEENRG